MPLHAAMDLRMEDKPVTTQNMARVAALAAAFVLSVSLGTARTEEASIHANPDPKNISGSESGELMRVSPRNDLGDYDNLQWVFDHVTPGGTVVLDSGTFFLGDGKVSPRRTVIIRKGVVVTGQGNAGAWHTIIRGGGEVMTPGVGGPLESGPIRIINEDDPNPVVFEGIWFREWAAEVIFIEASHGFKFRNNRISHPVNRASPGIRFVHALWSNGPKTRGDFIVEDCLVEMGHYTDEEPADDEQFLGIFFSNHDNIRIVNNVISGIDEAIEVLGNRYGNTGPGDPDAPNTPAGITVEGNRVISTGKPGENWPSSFSVLIAGNLLADFVQVKRNHITKSGKGWAVGLSGENLNVVENTLRFEEQNGAHPSGAIIIGGFGKLGPYEMGNSLINSTFSDNIFEGKVTNNGIFFWTGRDGAVRNESSGNFFDVGDSLAALGARATLFIGKDMHDNTFEGNLGFVVDEAPDGLNAY